MGATRQDCARSLPRNLNAQTMSPRFKLFTALALLFTLGVSACSKENVEEDEESFGGTHFHYFPRECTQILSLPMKTEQTVDYAGRVNKRDVVVGEEGVEAKDFLYWLMTGAGDLDSLELYYSKHRGRLYEHIYHQAGFKAQLAMGIRPLEKEMIRDYRIGIAGPDAMKPSEPGVMDMNLMPWEYRVTGVKDFKIVALTPLFGLPAETALNRFFTIHELEPKQIVSSQSKRLAWGYRSKDQVTSIDQWLAMRPTAQPVMMLRLNTVPQEVPVKTRFVAILTTEEGKEVRDTLQVLLK